MNQDQNTITNTIQVSAKDQIKLYPKTVQTKAALIMKGENVERFITTSNDPVMMSLYLTNFMVNDGCFDDFKSMLDHRILCSEIKLVNDVTLLLKR